MCQYIGFFQQKTEEISKLEKKIYLIHKNLNQIIKKSGNINFLASCPLINYKNHY